MSVTRQVILLSVSATLLLLQGCSGSSQESSVTADGSGLGAGEQSQPDDYVPGDDGVTGLDQLGNEAPNEYNPGPEGDSRLVYDGQNYALDAGLGDIWGSFDDHYKIAFTLTNGKFEISPTVIEGVTHNLLTPVIATAVFYAELYSPGDSFSFSTYSHSPIGTGDGTLAGNAFFDKAYVHVDANGTGGLEADERMTVTGGLVEFTGVLPDIEVRFSVTVENGQTINGHYTGLFDFTNR